LSRHSAKKQEVTESRPKHVPRSGTATSETARISLLAGGSTSQTETFWTEWDGRWSETCRKHCFFTHQRDDEGIGAHLRPTSVRGGEPAPTDRFRWATCELGGGMAAAYHRRQPAAGPCPRHRRGLDRLPDEALRAGGGLRVKVLPFGGDAPVYLPVPVPVGEAGIVRVEWVTVRTQVIAG